MKLWFDEGGLAGDFCCYRDLPEWWNATEQEREDFYVQFRAYNNRNMMDKHEERMVEDGFDYECFVTIECDPPVGSFKEWTVGHFLAHDRIEAEWLMQLAANALYGKEW